MAAPALPRCRSVPSIEAAIVTTELQLSEHLAHLAWCRTVGRDATVAESLAQSAELRLEGLWRERDWQLVHQDDEPGRPA